MKITKQLKIYKKRKRRAKQKTESTLATINKLRCLLTRRDKVILVFLFAATVVSSIIEILSVGIIMPLITFANNPNLILTNPYSKKIYEFLGFNDTLEFMVAFCWSLVAFYIFRTIYGIFHTYCLSRFSARKLHFFTYKLFQRSIELNYLDFIKLKSDKIRSNITNEASKTSMYVRSLLQLFTEVFTMVVIYLLLLIANWMITLALTIILGIQVYLVMNVLGNKLKRRGAIESQTNANFNEIITKTFGNFKMIKLKGNQKEVCKEFTEVSNELTKTRIIMSTILPIPRHLLETVGFVILVICIWYVLAIYKDFEKVLPIISMYALALYKILPAVSRILDAYNQMASTSSAVSVVYEALRHEPNYEANQKCDFKEKIELQNISFWYDENKPILKNINLTINKGDKIAFCGESGIGKSTLVDIIIGIYKPQYGKILVDSQEINSDNLRSWRKKIGYIPQTIYLFDGSVAENVAFGSVLDEGRVKEACRKANILEFLDEHNGIHTRVGEGGILLSGGQKQRIGIARAIYDNPEILVLDEATSALDSATEEKIMDEIYDVAHNKTLLVIAHRLNTIERCERKVEFTKGYDGSIIATTSNHIRPN